MNAEKVLKQPVNNLIVRETFLSIQGEGPFAGQPAFFIRLAGCNLSCPFCDTDHTSKQRKMNPGAIAAEVLHSCPPNRLVIITGGEPFNQNIIYLTNMLLDYSYRVQIETNGTLYLKHFPYDRVTIVCSPKTPQIDERLVPFVDAFKYVVAKNGYHKANGLPTNALGIDIEPHVYQFPPWFNRSKVFIQPLDEKSPEMNKRNLKKAIDICEHFGYTLCLQLHKLIGKE